MWRSLFKQKVSQNAAEPVWKTEAILTASERGKRLKSALEQTTCSKVLKEKVNLSQTAPSVCFFEGPQFKLKFRAGIYLNLQRNISDFTVSNVQLLSRTVHKLVSYVDQSLDNLNTTLIQSPHGYCQARWWQTDGMGFSSNSH